MSDDPQDCPTCGAIPTWQRKEIDLPAARPQGTAIPEALTPERIAEARAWNFGETYRHPTIGERKRSHQTILAALDLASRASPPSPGVSREQVIEECARVCDELSVERRGQNDFGGSEGAEDCAIRIRNILFSPAPALPSQQENLDR